MAALAELSFGPLGPVMISTDQGAAPLQLYRDLMVAQ